jgi:hypothetical protein
MKPAVDLAITSQQCGQSTLREVTLNLHPRRVPALALTEVRGNQLHECVPIVHAQRGGGRKVFVHRFHEQSSSSRWD